MMERKTSLLLPYWFQLMFYMNILSYYCFTTALSQSTQSAISTDQNNNESYTATVLQYTTEIASRLPPEKEIIMTDEQRLLYKLMDNYDNSVRPVMKASSPVVVHLGITLTQIMDIDEKNQILTSNVWLDQSWFDEKLNWDPNDFSGISKFRIPCDFIWRPDIVLYNSAESLNQGYMKSLAMIDSNGSVFWPPIVRMRSSCKMDITYFPFDDQICKLKLGSWAYDGFQVDVTNLTDNIDLSNYVNNGEWTLVATKVIRNEITYPCCPEPFPDVTFYVQVRRRILYYCFNVIIPCVLLSTLSLTGFCLPPDSGEKVTLGLTVLLAFSVFMLLIAENMPATSEFVPLIGIYLTVIMAMSALSVVFSVFILNLHHRGSFQSGPPFWLRKLSYLLSRLLCMEWTDTIPNRYCHSSLHNKMEKLSRESYGSDRHSHCGVRCNGVGHEKITDCSTSSGVNAQTQSILAQENSFDDEMMRYLRYIIAMNDRCMVERKFIQEWQEIAKVMDRFFFGVFLGITVSSTFILLVINPMTKDISLEHTLP
ncbi:neuronal acetylcholine receptor subunit alpha-10-like [Argonauta hians]